MQPPAEQPNAHRRARGVEQLQQGAAAAAEPREQLEVHSRVRIKPHTTLRRAHLDAQQLRADDDARALAVRENRACCTQRRRDGIDAQSIECDRPRGPAQPVRGSGDIEERCGERRDAHAPGERGRQRRPVRDEHLRRIEARELVGKRHAAHVAGNLEQLQTLRVGVERRDARHAGDHEHADAARDRRGLEQLGLDHHARAQHSRHRSADEPSGDHLADLVPDGRGVTRVQQLANVLRQRLVREPAHRQASGRAEPATRQRETEDRRGLLGIRPEHLEEVAEAGQHDGVRKVGLDGAILAEDRCVAGSREVERVSRRLRRRCDEVRSPNLRARSHAAVPTGSTCSCHALDSVTRAVRNSPTLPPPTGSHATLFSRVRPYGRPSAATPSTSSSTS